MNGRGEFREFFSEMDNVPYTSVVWKYNKSVSTFDCILCIKKMSKDMIGKKTKVY